MLPNLTLPVPGSLIGLLATFGPMFTAPSFRTFCGLACGFFAQTRETDGVRDAGRRGTVPDVAA
jgi:hypothetical protein